MRTIFSVTAMSALLTLLRMLLGFIIVKIVAVYSGPNGMALLGQVQNMVNSLNGIANSPAGNGIVRYTAQNQDKGDEYCSGWWKASIQLILLITVLFAVPGVFFSAEISQWLFQTKHYGYVVQLAILLMPLSALGTLFSSVLNGKQQYKRFIITSMISVLISSAIIIALVALFSIEGILIAAVAQSAAIGLVLVLSNIAQPWTKMKLWWGSSTNEKRKEIGLYMLMALTSSLTLPISLILIRNILVDHAGWDAAGQWQAVWKISEVYLGIITISLSTYFIPTLSTLKSPDDIINKIHDVLKIILPVVAVVAIIVYMLRDVAIFILFTKEFSASRDLFAIQLIGDVVKVVGWLYACPMISRGATKWFIFSEIFFSMVFVAVGWVLIPKFGAEGANIAYLVNYSLYLIFMVANVRRFSR
ncbi:O-antigen translocase [Kosakonia cowanii]|uniref:O-antigen translocase n=1 Tax=Kosakonia cowanii TaxID=208223 RepID=UPI0023F87FFE|nr:O-antigen translocase [Kosakonia cowanii]MDF7760036.1 O-antigen translocase [Kosakonia cowanii]